VKALNDYQAQQDGDCEHVIITSDDTQPDDWWEIAKESDDDRVSCMFSFIVLQFNLPVQGFSNCGTHTTSGEPVTFQWYTGLIRK
jgi:hypothetical protein